MTEVLALDPLLEGQPDDHDKLILSEAERRQLDGNFADIAAAYDGSVSASEIERLVTTPQLKTIGANQPGYTKP